MHCYEIAGIKSESKRKKAYHQEVSTNMWFQDTLQSRVSCKIGLTESEADSLYFLFSKGCRQHTKGRLRSVISFIPSIPNYGIYSRIMFGNGVVSYCAGQSYPDEITTVRNLLLGKE